MLRFYSIQRAYRNSWCGFPLLACHFCSILLTHHTFNANILCTMFRTTFEFEWQTWKFMTLRWAERNQKIDNVFYLFYFLMSSIDRSKAFYKRTLTNAFDMHFIKCLKMQAEIQPTQIEYNEFCCFCRCYKANSIWNMTKYLWSSMFRCGYKNRSSKCNHIFIENYYFIYLWQNKFQILWWYN